MDVLDEKILTLLQEDAALSISEIAARIGLSQTPCWKRIQRLEAEGVILRRVALLDPEKVGLGLCAIVSIVAGEHSGRWLEEFTAYVSERPEVVDCAGATLVMMRTARERTDGRTGCQVRTTRMSEAVNPGDGRFWRF
jgi:DNA-binding Lrp family transcriptional regulator